MKNWLIPHPNVSNAEFGDAHLKRVTTLFNENFAKLDALMQSAQSSVSSLESSKSNDGHNHDESYAQLEHKHVPDDVTGLSSLLDNKANLNHEHPQYLTEVTAHQHETNEVNGLIEALNGKAPTAHGHTFADVDGLDDLSTSAARIDYVDQRDTEKLAAAMAYTDAAVSGIVVPEASTVIPENVVAKPEDETHEQALERVGISPMYARADHQHVFDTDLGKEPTDIGGEDAMPSGNEGTETEQEVGTLWTAGGENGAKIFVFYAEENPDTSGAQDLHACRISISPAGTIVKIETTDAHSGIYIGA